MRERLFRCQESAAATTCTVGGRLNRLVDALAVCGGFMKLAHGNKWPASVAGQTRCCRLTADRSLLMEAASAIRTDADKLVLYASL